MRNGFLASMRRWAACVLRRWWPARSGSEDAPEPVEERAPVNFYLDPHFRGMDVTFNVQLTRKELRVPL